MLKGHVYHLKLLEQGSHLLILGYSSTNARDAKGSKIGNISFSSFMLA